MQAKDYARASAGDLVQALAAGKVSSAELVETAIGLIEAKDGDINAVVVRDFDRARARAAAADIAIAQGERGPLLGVPMTVKESYNIAGLPTTWGFEAFAGWTAKTDAVAIQRLAAAGAVIIGKTNVPPSLADWQSANPVYGRTNNPHDLGRSPGGSSGGSAASIAAGYVPLELGSDIGGSIRVPAAFCGVYGLKPSYGVVPMEGHAVPGQDGMASPLSVGGPLARTAQDLDLALSVLAGPSTGEAVGYSLHLPPARHHDLRGFRVLILAAHPFADVDGEVAAAVERLAELLSNTGALVTRTSAHLPHLAEAHRTYVDILTTVTSRRAGDAARNLSAHRWLDLLDEQLQVRRAWARVFEEVDIVLSPTLGVVAFPHDPEPQWRKRSLMLDGEPSSFGAQLAWPGMAILGLLPSVAFPFGSTREGLPIGLQAMGPYLEDHTAVAFAAAVGEAFGTAG